MPVREFGRFYPILHSNQMSWLANLTLHVTLQIERFQFPESAHISQFDHLLDQRESSTHLKVTNQDLLWQHKCVFLFTLQFESIAGVLLRIFSHWKSKTNFFHIFILRGVKLVS